MIGLNTLKRFRETRVDLTEPERVHRSADMYWMLFLIIGGVLLLFATGFGVRQYLIPPSPLEATPTVGEGTATYDRTQLKAVLKVLQDREAQFQMLLH